jgi:hypothetical protein
VNAGGFGNRGVEGKILAANYARTHKIPYLGICLGMQVGRPWGAMQLGACDKEPTHLVSVLTFNNQAGAHASNTEASTAVCKEGMQASGM